MQKVNSRRKGRRFEEQIAQELRQIYDSSPLIQEMAEAAKKKDNRRHRELLKKSLVRRSDQGRGANEPDLVIEGCPCWLELQDARAPTPLKKLEQAEGDTAKIDSRLRPVAITHKIGSQSIQVMMRYHDLTMITHGSLINLVDIAREMPVTIDFEHFKAILKDYDEREREEARKHFA